MCGNRRVLFPNSAGGLPAEEITIARALQGQGYATAQIGKWHLGIHAGSRPQEHGFELTFGLPYSNDMDARPDLPRGSAGSPNPPRDGWNVPLLRNGQVVERPVDQTTLTRRYTEEATRFIRQQKERPFFLYFAHTFPHVPLFASPDFQGRSRAGIYGDTVEELDWSGDGARDATRRTSPKTPLCSSPKQRPVADHGRPRRQPRSAHLQQKQQEGGSCGHCGSGRIRGVTTNGLGDGLFATSLSMAGVPLPEDRAIDGVDLSLLVTEGKPAGAAFSTIGRRRRPVDSASGKPTSSRRRLISRPQAETHRPPLLFHLGRPATERHRSFGRARRDRSAALASASIYRRATRS